MGDRLFFEIPDGNETAMVGLVRAVPSTWSWMDGFLEAPDKMKAAGMTAPDTVLAIDRFNSIRPTLRGTGEDDRVAAADLYAIFVDQKLPEGLRFSQAGYGHDISLELAKKIAVAYIEKGYRGRLEFFSGLHDNRTYENRERCFINLAAWEGAPMMGDEAGPQPARVKLEWNEHYSGRRENLEPIVLVCRALELRQYKPVAGR